MKFTVMSRANAKAYTFNDGIKVPYLMVSINDANSLPNMFKRDHMMKGLCILHFDDVESGKNAMRPADAHKILTEIDASLDEISEIIVHCGAGVSRSAGVCAALMKILTDNDEAIFNNAQYKPNMACYRKVLNAYFGAPSFGQAILPPRSYPKINAFRMQSMHAKENQEKSDARAGVTDHLPLHNRDGIDASTDKEVYNQNKKKTVAQEVSDVMIAKAMQTVQSQKNMLKDKPYVICIKKVADIYGKALSESEREYEYAQIDTRTALSHGYPDWGPENGAMKFESDTAAAEWFAENKKHLMSYKQQYDWSTLAIRQVSYSYIALTCEDPEPDELTLEQAIAVIAEKQSEANKSSDNAAAGYDEGYYSGQEEAFGIALDIIKKIKL